MCAPSKINQMEQPLNLRELGGVRLPDASQDAKDLHVLSPLKHRGGDEQPKQSRSFANPQFLPIDGESADVRRVAEHSRDAGVIRRTVVEMEVPSHHRCCRADLNRGRLDHHG
jgi:hypothetical protein